MNQNINEKFIELFSAALSKRENIFQQLLNENTDSYRLFHGISEGMPGLTIDRYGTLVLVQTFRESLSTSELNLIEVILKKSSSKFGLTENLRFAYNHRGKKVNESFDQWHVPSAFSLEEVICKEFGVDFFIRARHQGIDPWLFLDLRAGRRFLRNHIKGKSVLNLFSYTCSAGVTAAVAGASEVWNVDFASSSLAIGSRNAELNKITNDYFHNIQEDCLPVIRKLAGLPTVGRYGKEKTKLEIEARHFDWVFVDPPTWSKSHFGAIDIKNDYASIFKPAVLIANPNSGKVLATNHLATVDIDAWTDVLTRCAKKAGRPLRSIQIITPEEDFPSFDNKHPLKIAVCEV